MNYDIQECLFFRKGILDYFSTVLSADELNELTNGSITKTIKKGYPIFKAGEKPVGLIYVLSGSAKVFKLKSGKREQIVRLVGSSSFVGYKALFAEKEHTTSASTTENTEIMIINRDKLFSILDHNPKFSRLIIKALASELSFNFERLVNLTQKKVRSRLAETLILLSDIYGFEKGSKTLNVKITRENMGFFSNMTTSNAIRTLKAFEKEGLVETSNHQLTLLEIEKIRILGKGY